MTFAFLIDSVTFTDKVIAGETSLGGSESACLGLARALQKRGHDVHLFVSDLAVDAGTRDHAGVTWHPLAEFHGMNQFIEWDVVCPLRMIAAFAWRPIWARLRLLWNQDLLVPGQMQMGVMAVAWAIDHLCYVSEYHRKQWEQLQPDLKPLGWVTRNAIDLAQVPKESRKDPNRIIHISRPERGLGPLLSLWPLLKAKVPDATLQVCRYSSMYDQGPGSWSEVCNAFDARVKQVNEEVGGIEYLGELSKPQLYQAISDAAVMWYPGVAGFAETSCIAAIEANACGTPFVGSYRGALPETAKPSKDAGLLIRGNAGDEAAYASRAVEAVRGLLEGCASNSFQYRALQKAGRKYAEAYGHEAVAAEWEAQIETWFRERYESHKVGVLRQLLHEDDHVAAQLVAAEVGDAESTAALDLCERVIAGKDQSAENYSEHAIADPLKEAEFSGRFHAVAPMFEGCSNVLDVACGNGSFAIVLARKYPHIRIHGLDYAQGNIDRAREAAERAGLADRLTFERCTVYNYDARDLHDDFLNWTEREARAFDGMFVGEFVEHVAGYQHLIDGLEGACKDGAKVVYTCPNGACVELMPRGIPLRKGHVSRFAHDDITAVWGPKKAFKVDYFVGGLSLRGNPQGNWIIQYTVEHAKKAGARKLQDRIVRTRPFQRVSVGMIVKDAENDLGRCLASVWKVADEIVIGDTGSSDSTKTIAASYGATVIDLPSVMDTPDGFAGARNAVLNACSGDWFLWIDADEQLMNGHWLRRYLDGAIYQGFVLQQTHLYLDGPPTFDIPVRIFRNTGKVKFYGCIHEQPQDGDPNADIYPTLAPQDVKIAHTGYLTEEAREEKRVERNLPLLLRDAKVFPDRVLGKVLLLREATIQADHHRAEARGQLVPRAQQGYVHAIKLFIEHFDDPDHKYHKLARPWYEAALRHLGIGWELEIAIAGKQGGMQGSRAETQRVWVRDAAEAERVLAWKAKSVAKGIATSKPVYLTDPDDERLQETPTPEAVAV